MVKSLISVILINYNSKNLILKCLDSIYHQTYDNFEVIIIDNASEDDSVKYIKKYYPQVKLIKNKENLGFAEANNMAIRVSKGEFILFCNPDTIMTENFLNKITEPMRDKKIGVVAPRIITKDGNVDSLGIMIKKSGLGYDIKNDKERDEHLIAGCGACVLYRRKTLEDVKVINEYMDSDFFVYCEDSDLGIRCILKGWGITYSDVVIVHEHSSIMKKAPVFIQQFGHRNNVLSIIKNYPIKMFIKYLPQILFWQLASVCIWCLRGKPLLIMKLKWDALKMIPKMLKKRKIIQEGKTITDKEFEERFA